MPRSALCMLQEAGDGDKEVHFDPFADLPADFGPEVPDEGVDGLLFVSASWDTVAASQGTLIKAATRFCCAVCSFSLCCVNHLQCLLLGWLLLHVAGG